jgi:hypothetical protein
VGLPPLHDQETGLEALMSLKFLTRLWVFDDLTRLTSYVRNAHCGYRVYVYGIALISLRRF